MLTTTNIWELYWILSSQMTKTFRDNLDKNTVQQTSCDLFFRCSNAVKNVLFRSFCTPMYASQIWWNFRKSCMKRLRVAHNFGWKVPYNPPWRASISSHDSSGSMQIPTFEALLRKNMYLFLERCRRSNNYNVWLPVLTQSDCLYSSLFFEYYNRILLCDWVLEYCRVCSLEGVHDVTMHSYFTWPWPV